MELDKIKSLTKDFFKDTYPLSEKSFSHLKKILSYHSIKKNEKFIKTGQKNNSEYFILEGFCRSFLVNPEGEEITLAFFKKHNAVSPHIIRTKNGNSTLNFQALTDLDLVEFNAETFLSMMIEDLELRDFGNHILRQELIRKTEKEMAFVSQSAKERLVKFREEYALLENLIPHPIIASYIGITNISLSRLRGEVKKA